MRRCSRLGSYTLVLAKRSRCRWSEHLLPPGCAELEAVSGLTLPPPACAFRNRMRFSIRSPASYPSVDNLATGQHPLLTSSSRLHPQTKHSPPFQVGHAVDSTLAVRHDLTEQECKRAERHLCAFRAVQRPVEDTCWALSLRAGCSSAE